MKAIPPTETHEAVIMCLIMIEDPLMLQEICLMKGGKGGNNSARQHGLYVYFVFCDELNELC